MTEPEQRAISCSDHEFALAEFVQLHEHLRQRDTSMVQFMTVVLVSTTAILSGGGAVVFQSLADGKQTSMMTAYVFMIPLSILLPSFAILRSHRKSVYRMGTYVGVFLENPPRGAQWHRALLHFRQSDKGESFDYVPISIWALALPCFGLFWMTLGIAGASVGHWLAPIPFAIILGILHWRFMDAKNSSEMEEIWRRTQKVLGDIERPPITPRETAPPEPSA